MAHLAFLPLPAHGHVTPTLAVVAELVSRGHRVTFATSAELAGTVAGAGATPLEYRSLLAGKPQPDAFTAEYVSREPLRCIEEAAQVTAQLLPAFAADVPDLVVYDVSTFPTGRALAALLDRPAAQLFPVFASNERFSFGAAQGDEMAALGESLSPQHPAFAEFFERTAEFLAGHGLAGIGLERFLRPCDDRNLVFLPREFQLQSDRFDDRHAFVGPCLRPAAGNGTAQPAPPGDGPLVLVSLGTTFNRNAELFRSCGAAFARTPWRVVITLGTGGVDPADLGDLPPNVRALRWAPHTELLREASAFVCHAGMGSMMEALAHATPLVLVPPDVTEHRLNARRAAELGLGRELRLADASAERLRDTVQEVAGSPDVRARVEEMARFAAHAGGPVRAADVLEAALPVP